MPEIKVREAEYFDVALRRFKKAVEKAGTLTSLGVDAYFTTQINARFGYAKPSLQVKN